MLEGTLKIIWFHPLPWAGSSSTSPGCSELHPTSSVSRWLSGLRNFYIIYHWITSLLFFQYGSSFGSSLFHEFLSSRCGLGKSQVQVETGNTLQICQTFGTEVQCLAAGWVLTWWNAIVKTEPLAQHVWSVQIPDITDYKLQENLQWSILIHSTIVIVKHGSV